MAKLSKVEVIHLQKKYGTDEAIGKKLGITRQAVEQWRKKYGIDSRWARNPDRNKKMVALYKAGRSGTEIAAKFGMSVSQTYRLISGKKRKK
ncbi:MAG TPA: helix-turn-helix domain-containing protein [Chitinivibrionales bacterium]|nr:helix-turn-helix domain-containing protein [Chitinivibrionales bacterium]